MGEMAWRVTCIPSISESRRGTLQEPSATVRYTLPWIITCLWQACASAIEGQGTFAFFPAYGGNVSGTM